MLQNIKIIFIEILKGFMPYLFRDTAYSLGFQRFALRSRVNISDDNINFNNFKANKKHDVNKKSEHIKFCIPIEYSASSDVNIEIYDRHDNIDSSNYNRVIERDSFNNQRLFESRSDDYNNVGHATNYHYYPRESFRRRRAEPYNPTIYTPYTYNNRFNKDHNYEVYRR